MGMTVSALISSSFPSTQLQVPLISMDDFGSPAKKCDCETTQSRKEKDFVREAPGQAVKPTVEGVSAKKPQEPSKATVKAAKPSLKQKAASAPEPKRPLGGIPAKPKKTKRFIPHHTDAMKFAVFNSSLNPRDYLILDANNSDIPDFDPTARVVIVTKIQGKNTVGALNQSLCLLSYAYNHRVNYDIVVFSATMISDKQLDLIRTTVYPANFTFVLDNPGLTEMIDSLDDERKRKLFKRCNVTNSTEIDWKTRCLEKSSSGTTNMPIQYTWQAEFRSLHLWTHPALAKYKYMLWLDTDGFCTKVWKQDPIAIMRRNDMVFLFDNFPQGQAKGVEWPYLSQKAFGRPYCGVRLSRKGHLKTVGGNCLGHSVALNQVHGFFHFTDLDFYRSAPVINWQRIMIGNSTFSRKYDDQIAVTFPAAVLAGNRSWDMRSIGLNLSVVHDFLLDGKKDERVGGFIGFWNTQAKHTFPEAYGKCNAVSPG